MLLCEGAATMTAVNGLTYADYTTLPNDGKRYEILDGVLHVAATPGRTHQRVVLRLAGALDAHVTAHEVGEIEIAPFDVILSDPNVVEPDIIFVATERMPSSARIDRNTKLQIYGRHGVPYYWIVEPEERAIDVHFLAGSSYGTPARFVGDLVDLAPFSGLRLDP